MPKVIFLIMVNLLFLLPTLNLSGEVNPMIIKIPERASMTLPKWLIEYGQQLPKVVSFCCWGF